VTNEPVQDEPVALTTGSSHVEPATPATAGSAASATDIGAAAGGGTVAGARAGVGTAAGAGTAADAGTDVSTAAGARARVGTAAGGGGHGQLWLIRHGETEWSKARRHTGRTDVPLTETGERQARALRELLGGLRPVLVLCSPRQRARRTAELAGLGPIVPCDDLAEWDYGSYEGLTTAQIKLDRPGWTVWSGEVPGGETAEQIGARADRVLARLRPALADGDVVAVAHGHLGRVLTARWLGLEPTGGRHFALEPASPCVLDTEHGIPVVYRWNLPNPAAVEPAPATIPAAS
jgi:broad specificity phosphatase PhoE